MPALGAAAIVEIISAAVAAAGTGVSMYEGSQQRDAQKQMMKSQQQAQAQQQALQRKEAVLAAGPQAQAQTSGSLTGAAGQSFIDLLAGVPQHTGMATGQPSTPGTPSAPTGQTTQQMGTEEMISRLGQPPQGNFSGGWSQAPETPYGPFQLSSFQAGG